LDVILASLDWLSLILVSMDTNSGGGMHGLLRVSTRATRYMRAMRILRMPRKIKKVIRHMDTYFTERVLVLANLVGAAALILLINHYIACIWYALAKFNRQEKITWVKNESDNANGDDLFLLYAISLHWSLTQFTPATNNIAPTNVRERIFCIGVVLFALFAFSQFLGQITNGIMTIKKLNKEQHREKKRYGGSFWRRQCP